MKNTVIIKGNRYGISIILNEEMSFEDLLVELQNKLSAADEFFDCDKQLVVSFEGRNLSNEELDQILTVIDTKTKLKISYIMDHNSDLEATFYDIIQAAQNPENEDNYDQVSTEKKSEAILAEKKDDCSGLFYRGTLQAGQTFETKESVVVIGDVKEGAEIVAGGNIVIIGRLKGIAKAGCKGDKNAFVMALSMEPQEIEIDGVAAKQSALKRASRSKKESMIAILIDQYISIDPISKSAINDFHF